MELKNVRVEVLREGGLTEVRLTCSDPPISFAMIHFPGDVIIEPGQYDFVGTRRETVPPEPEPEPEPEPASDIEPTETAEEEE